ncbi:hypothetical protein [Bdellovibrio sp. HCB288]|uniref:hypothetical protein n=1 Tax=Bdellovibrio sp. HCB288 TaxID=3394355 RepID=UPI0039B69B94
MFKGICLATISLVIFSFASAKYKGTNDPTAGAGDPTVGYGDPTAGSGDPTAGFGDPTSGRKGNADKSKSDLPQKNPAQVNRALPVVEKDSLSSSVQHMTANSWDLNADPISSSQDVVLKKINFKGSNDPTAGSGEYTAGSGDPTAGSGDPTKGSGDPTADSGNLTAGHLADFEKVLLPARAYDKHPRCKIIVVRKSNSSNSSETLTIGSGSQLRLSAIKISPAKVGGHKTYNARYDVIRSKEKKAELSLVCDLSSQAAVSISEIQEAFSKLGFVGTVPLGFKDSPAAASKDSSVSAKTGQY